MQLPLIDDYQQLFLSDTPLLDVRAPVEFSQGAFPQAANVPLINDDERHAIGIRYAELGQDQAIALGHELVNGETKHKRIADWFEFTQQHPQGALYCFRGGMRSRISQEWIYAATGVAYPRIKGGYKAMRRFLLSELEHTAATFQALVVGGRTGVGKTELLQNLSQQIDLEGIYHHRGSTFGKHATPQPSQIDIENALAIRLLKLRNADQHKIVLEDEAPNIGSRSVPAGVIELIQTAPLILLEENLETRVQHVFNEYINASLAEYQQLQGDALGFENWAGNLRSALERIQRRLGRQRHQQINLMLNDAIQQQRLHNERENHKHWIQAMLVDYYDPMYDYQLARKSERILFRGDRSSVLDYLREQHAIS